MNQIKNNLFLVTNLEPLDLYYFRVIAANCAGFGQPSVSSPPFCLTNNSTNTNQNNSYSKLSKILNSKKNCAKI